MLILAAAACPAFAAATYLANKLGVVGCLPLLPLINLAFGAAVVGCTALASSLALPRAGPGKPVILGSHAHARRWFVGRLVNTCNTLFMWQFRGTYLTTCYLRLLVCWLHLAS